MSKGLFNLKKWRLEISFGSFCVFKTKQMNKAFNIGSK
jgi:hypothetical protein